MKSINVTDAECAYVDRNNESGSAIWCWTLEDTKIYFNRRWIGSQKQAELSINSDAPILTISGWPTPKEVWPQIAFELLAYNIRCTPLHEPLSTYALPEIDTP